MLKALVAPLSWGDLIFGVQVRRRPFRPNPHTRNHIHTRTRTHIHLHHA